MSSLQDNFDLIDNLVDKQVNKFLEGVDKSQSGIFNKVMILVKELDLDYKGDIIQNQKNLKLLNEIRKQITDNILTETYVNRVNKLTDQMPVIASLNNDYFETLTNAFTPNRQTYKTLIKTSQQLTKNSLLESGINQNVIDPVVNIVNNSIISGAGFTDMIDELKVTIKGNDEVLGGLQRYASQITQDALNQFNANYNETIATDLDLEWYYYSGGRSSTSRPFCKAHAGKFYHKKEIEDFGKGYDIDGNRLSGHMLDGRIRGTNASNIFYYRGGYNCKHVYKPTLINSVPKYVIKRNIEKGYFEQ